MEAAEGSAHGLEGQGLAQALEHFHPLHPLLEFHGFTMPVRLFPADRSQWHDLEAPLATISNTTVMGDNYYSPDWDDQHDNVRDLQRHLVTAAAKGRWNGLAYSLDKMSVTEAGVLLECGLGRYFQSLVTSDALDIELTTALAESHGATVDPACLTRRSWLADRVGDPVLDGARRCAALSVACAVIARRKGGGYTLFLAPRSANTARHSFFNHVAPAGILQPPHTMEDQWLPWFSVRANVLKEFAEELYTTPAATLEQEIAIDGLEGVPEVARLLRLLDDGGATLYYTGVSVNMLMLRPEICTLLFVEDDDWLERERLSTRHTARAFTYSDEYLKPGSHDQLPQGRQHLQHLDLDDEWEPLGFRAELRPRALVPNAAGAIALATNLLRAGHR